MQTELLSSVPLGEVAAQNETHYSASRDFFPTLRMKIGEDYNLYRAGANSYERPFLRDSIVATTLAEDIMGLKEILRFAATIQGVKKDPRTGEQPGAIFHEYDPILNDGVELPDRPGKTTMYNACDSNALFLMGHEEYKKLTGDESLALQQQDNILAATGYILRHLDEKNQFVVDPRHSDADGYALRVTYWKDSQLKGRDNGEPLYPVIYPLAHIQNMAGLRSAGRLLGSEELLQKADDMRDAIPNMFDENRDTFKIAIDQGGSISGISSDVLHALYYLEPGDIDAGMLERVLQESKVLETSMGYRTLSPEDSEEVEDKYHALTVWVHEQGLIHAGAQKHLQWAEKNNYQSLQSELQNVTEVSSRTTPYLKNNPTSNPELFLITSTGEIVPGGCDPQLWAEAARIYYENHDMKSNPPSQAA